jgi:hypothetical protein
MVARNHERHRDQIETWRVRPWPPGRSSRDPGGPPRRPVAAGPARREGLHRPRPFVVRHEGNRPAYERSAASTSSRDAGSRAVGRLVEQQDVRARHDPCRQCQPGLLPAGQHGGRLVDGEGSGKRSRPRGPFAAAPPGLEQLRGPGGPCSVPRWPWSPWSACGRPGVPGCAERPGNAAERDLRIIEAVS